MDRSERVGDAVVAARNAAREQRADMWTAMPAVVETYDNTKHIVSAQPTIKGRFRDPKGNQQWVQMPLCLDCPVHFSSGGGYTLTFPITKGDEGLLVFASRCIDAWWQSGGIQNQADLRMHNLSDGFYIPGVRSQPRKLSPAPSTNSAQLRSDDGKTYVDIASGKVTVTPDQGVTTFVMQASKVQVILGAYKFSLQPSRMDINADFGAGDNRVLCEGGPIPNVWAKLT